MQTNSKAVVLLHLKKKSEQVLMLSERSHYSLRFQGCFLLERSLHKHNELVKEEFNPWTEKQSINVFAVG